MEAYSIIPVVREQNHRTTELPMETTVMVLLDWQ